MFLALEIIKPFILPPALIALGMAMALLYLYRKRVRIAKNLLLITFVIYYLLSIKPTAFILTSSLVRATFSPPITLDTFKDNLPEVIVILAGGVNPKDETRPLSELSGASWRRLWHGLEVYRQLDGKAPILYSGDSGDPFG